MTTTASSGTVRFEPGDTTEFVEINIDGGNLPEWDEYFTIFLRNPAGATIARAFGTVTILNDDVPTARRRSRTR